LLHSQRRQNVFDTAVDFGGGDDDGTVQGAPIARTVDTNIHKVVAAEENCPLNPSFVQA
jgi:hypothetical protein